MYSTQPTTKHSARMSRLKTSASVATLLALTSLATPALAQTIINDGDNVTVTSQAPGEIISAAEGVTSTVDGAPVVVIANDDVTLNNAGTLATLGITQTVEVQTDTTGAIINNSGTLLGDSRVVQIDGDFATLNNTGQIIGTGNQRNGTVYTNDTANNFDINNTGPLATIHARVGNNDAGVSLSLADEVVSGTLTNSGTITGRGEDGDPLPPTSPQAGDGVRLEGVRGIDAMGNVTFAPATFDGTITNSGTIESVGNVTGSTSGFHAVNGVSFQGTLTNEEGGTISGVQNGVYFGNPVEGGGADHTGGVVNNFGTISSDSRAFNLDGIGLTVNNSGDIIGTADQRNGTFYADGTADDFTVNNLEGGVIDAGMDNQGSGFGAEIGSAEDGANTFTLNNAGTIQGRGNAPAADNLAGDGIRIGNVGNVGVAEATITNSGLIASEGANGTVAGIRVVDNVSFSGTLTNQEGGVITGVQNGVYFGNADHSNAVVNNEEGAIISSGSRAFNVDGTGLTVNNDGTIIGLADQRNGTFYADGTADDFTVNNGLTGVIDAGFAVDPETGELMLDENGDPISNQGSGFGAEIGSAADGANTFTLVNDGTIQGRGNALASSNLAGDGIRIGNVGNEGITDATITNNGLIASEGANGTVAGVRVVDGVGFQVDCLRKTGP